MERSDPGALPRASCAYAERYCEENIWQLAGDPRLTAWERWVVFISNAGKSCALWQQSSARRVGEPVVWDYHVVLLARLQREQRVLVYDLDTALPFPTPLAHYLAETFPMEVPAAFRPVFRVIEADEYRRSFASDRSHMRDGDAWLAPPPPWPCIATAAETMNLSRFVDMSDAGGLGTLHDGPAALAQAYLGPPTPMAP